MLAVELSSYQLHWAPSLRAALRRRAQPRRPTTSTGTARWRRTPPTRAASTRATRSPASTTSPTRRPRTWSREADVEEGCRAIGFTLGAPGPSQARRGGRHPGRPRLRRGPAAERRGARPRSTTSTRPPRTTSPTPSPPPPWPAPTGCQPAAVRDGLRAFRPDAHRIALRGGRSTASPTSTTPRPPTPHAAAASLAAYEPIVWIAGGLAKGADLRRAGRPGRPSGCAARC